MLPNLAKWRRRRRRVLARFGRANRGATAVEFALVAPVFIGMLVAILEVAGFLFAQQTLQEAAVSAGRLIMTGQVQNGGVTQSQFAADICPMVSAVFSCSNLMINVQNYSDFGSANTSSPTLTFNPDGSVSNVWSYSPGTPGQVMVVQLIYQWPILPGRLGSMFPTLGNGNAELYGVTAFRIEPY